MIAALSHAASTVATLRAEVPVHKSLFRYWLDGFRFPSMALEGALLHVFIQNSRRNNAARTCARRVAMLDRRN